jgi:hypothetical protein
MNRESALTCRGGRPGLRANSQFSEVHDFAWERTLKNPKPGETRRKFQKSCVFLEQDQVGTIAKSKYPVELSRYPLCKYRATHHFVTGAQPTWS